MSHRTTRYDITAEGHINKIRATRSFRRTLVRKGVACVICGKPLKRHITRTKGTKGGLCHPGCRC